MYFSYLKYVLEHKKNVFRVCNRMGLFLHAFTHDMSKFSPKEFVPYAKWFNGPYGIAIKDKLDGLSEDVKIKHELIKNNFEKAWEHHYRNNKHHWQYWCYDWFKYETEPESPQLCYCEFITPLEMPDQYLLQMVCDWEAMSMKFGGSVQQYYLKNYYQIHLNPKSRYRLENLLQVYTKYFDYGQEYYFDTIGEIYNKLNRGDINNTCFKTVKEAMDSYYDEVNDLNNLNVYDCITESRNKCKK